MLLPDQITRDGNPINSTNNTVVVGQQINLTNMISGVPTSAITNWKWSIPGANGNTNTDTAIYDYEPDPEGNNSNYTNLVTPTNYLTNSSGIPFCNFYFTAPGTNQVSCTTVIYGQTNTISTSLNVVGPTQTRITASTGTVAADMNFNSGGMPVNRSLSAFRAEYCEQCGHSIHSNLYLSNRICRHEWMAANNKQCDHHAYNLRNSVSSREHRRMRHDLSLRGLP